MKTYLRSGGKTLHTLKFDIRYRLVVSLMPRLLYSGSKNLQYPWDGRLGWFSAGLETVAKRKNPITAPEGIEPRFSSP
jgi:hypothetical protein